MIRLWPGLAALVLMSCGELRDDNSTGAQVAGLLLGQGGEAPAATQSAVTEEDLLSNPGKFIRVNIRDLNRWDTAVVAGTNGARTTWIDSAGISVTLENGIVVATRGMPRDLMGAEGGSTWSAIRSGGGTVQRQHDFLTNQDQTSSEVLQCSIVSKGSEGVSRLRQIYPASRFEEICTSSGLTFTNIYWVNRSGVMIRSVQAVSPDAGYLQIDVF